MSLPRTAEVFSALIHFKQVASPFTRGKTQTWQFCPQNAAGLLGLTRVTLRSPRGVGRTVTPRSQQHRTGGFLPRKCLREERQSPLCFNTQNRTLYTLSLKYSLHGIQRRLHINTLKNPNPFYKRELKLVLVNSLNKPCDKTLGLDFCPKPLVKT